MEPDMKHEDVVYGIRYNDGAVQPIPSLQAALLAADSIYGGVVVWRHETPWEPLAEEGRA